MPSSGYGMVTIQVSDKVLYIGDATAYPLAGIVRVQWERLKIDQGRHIRAILVNFALFLIVFLVVQGIGDHLPGGQDGSAPPTFGWIEFATLLFFVIRSLEPARMLALSRRPYHALSIDTAGYAGSRLINPDGETLGRIARRIIDAIDNPAAEWQTQVNNYHVGDNIHQSGPASIGKVTT